MQLLVFLFLFPVTNAGVDPDLTLLRELYRDALQNKEKAVELISYIDKSNSTTLGIGYKGSATMLLAKHSGNPFRKYKYFNDGKSLLEEAIAKDSVSIELRYLRFSFQTNTPSFLGYNTFIQKDKIILLNSVKYISDYNLKHNILSLLKNSQYVNDNEKRKL